MFVHYNGKIVNADLIHSIDYSELVKKGIVKVYRVGAPFDLVDGPEAFNLVMEICPAALEGKRGEYARHAWAVHNLIGHPLMQIMAWLHLSQLGIKIHDATVPHPITK